MGRLGGAAAVSAREQRTAGLKYLGGPDSYCFELAMEQFIACDEGEQLYRPFHGVFQCACPVRFVVFHSYPPAGAYAIMPARWISRVLECPLTRSSNRTDPP